jgi:hypothetical protein
MCWKPVEHRQRKFSNNLDRAYFASPPNYGAKLGIVIATQPLRSCRRRPAQNEYQLLLNRPRPPRMPGRIPFSLTSQRTEGGEP